MALLLWMLVAFLLFSGAGAFGVWLQQRYERRLPFATRAATSPDPPALDGPPVTAIGAVEVSDDGNGLILDVRVSGTARVREARVLPLGWCAVHAEGDTLVLTYAPELPDARLTCALPPGHAEPVAAHLGAIYDVVAPRPVLDASPGDILAAPQDWAGQMVRMRAGWTYVRCHDRIRSHIEGLALELLCAAPCMPRSRGYDDPDPPAVPVELLALVHFEPRDPNPHPWAPAPLRLRVLAMSLRP
jgi:hypothetical protein